MKLNRQTLILFFLLTFALGLPAYAQDATPISVGDVVEGELSTGDRVEYTFEAVEGDSYNILVEGNFDTYLYLLDSKGTELTRNDDSGSTDRSLIRGFVIPTNGVYTIQVASFGDSGSGTYTLSITPFSSLDLTLGESTTATLDAENQTLYFTVMAEQGQVLDFVVDSGNTLDTKLEVIHPLDYSLATNDDSNRTVDPSLTSVVIDTDGRYILVVTAQNPNATLKGDVTVSAGAAELPSLDEGPVELSFTYEDTSSVATFEGTAGDKIRITTEVLSGEEWLSPRVSLRQEGTEFAGFTMYGVKKAIAELEIPADGEVQVFIEAYGQMTVSLTLGRILE